MTIISKMAKNFSIHFIFTFFHEILESCFESMSLFAFLLLGVKIVAVAQIARPINVGRDFADFDVELNVDVSFLADHDSVFQMKMQNHNHFFVARLEDRVLDIHVQNINSRIKIRN